MKLCNQNLNHLDIVALLEFLSMPHKTTLHSHSTDIVVMYVDFEKPCFRNLDATGGGA
jgi:hypothetical protein